MRLILTSRSVLVWSKKWYRINDMRKLLTGMLSAALALSTAAGAQASGVGRTWTDELGNTFTFQGCRRAGTDVICALSVVNPEDYKQVSWSNSQIRTYDANGRNSSAIAGSFAGGPWEPGLGGNLVAGVPTKLEVKVVVPAGAKTIHGLILDKKRLTNVPIQGATPTPAPVAATLTVKGVVYRANLSGCTTSGGATTCTVKYSR